MYKKSVILTSYIPHGRSQYPLLACEGQEWQRRTGQIWPSRQELANLGTMEGLEGNELINLCSQQTKRGDHLSVKTLMNLAIFN